MEREIKLEIEELEELIAPTPFSVNPGHGQGPFFPPVNASAATGVTAAVMASGGVITC